MYISMSNMYVIFPLSLSHNGPLEINYLTVKYQNILAAGLYILYVNNIK